jgi:hypothetical protein
VLCCADALVPFEYVQQLESVSNAAPNPGVHIYAAPVLFEQDASAVPGIVRATDYMWGTLAMQNLNGWTGIGFPISNYRCDAADHCGRGSGTHLPHAMAHDRQCHSGFARSVCHGATQSHRVVERCSFLTNCCCCCLLCVSTA